MEEDVHLQDQQQRCITIVYVGQHMESSNFSSIFFVDDDLFKELITYLVMILIDTRILTNTESRLWFVIIMNV